MKRDVTLRRRLARVFAVAGALVVIGAGAGAVAFSNLLTDRAAVIERIDPATIQAGNLLTAYVDEETGVRGYVLTADPQFLQPYQEGKAAASEAAAALSRLVPRGSPAAHLVAVAEQEAAAWQAEFATPAVQAASHGNRSFGQDALLAAGQQRFDRVRSAFTAVQAELAAERTRARTQLAASSDQLVAVLVIAAAVLALTGVVIWRALRGWVTAPLLAIGADARQVAAGDLDHTVAAVGPPEIAELAADIEAMRLELSRRNDELVRSNQDLEQFAYVASHDLQEPLRKVTSFCQLLQQRYADQLDERANQYIDFAVDGAKRMQVLINDLLAFSRVGRTTEGFEPVELALVLESALRNLAVAIEEAGATVDVETELPAVRGDKGLLAALMQNLVGNALKFRADEPPVVRIAATEEESGMWRVCVTDNGIGIEPRFADRIFVIFQRLHARDAYPGTGIGLALCKKIVEFHGGRIWLDAEHHPGARICFTIPALSEETPDEPE